MKLILASSSPYRQALLQRLQLPFESHAADVDETPLPDESPMDLAMRLATAKARAVAEGHPGEIVIGSDQVASREGTPIGKPGNFDTALQQLLGSSGRRVSFYTALSVVDVSGTEQCHLDPFHVHFRELTEPEIRRYLELEQPFDCAGSFKVEGLGISLFERLEGNDPTSLEGLPLIALCKILREMGQDPLVR